MGKWYDKARREAGRLKFYYDARDDSNIPGVLKSKWNKMRNSKANKKSLRKLLRKSGYYYGGNRRHKFVAEDGKYGVYARRPLFEGKVAAGFLSKLPTMWRKRKQRKARKMGMLAAKLRKSSNKAISKVGHMPELYNKIASYL